jgi:hypothetical protein
LQQGSNQRVECRCAPPLITGHPSILTFLLFYLKKVFCGSLYIIITGHAPHDEVPDEVNTILCKWVEQIEVKPALEKTKAI